MKFNTLTAVAAAACITLGSSVFAGSNNIPPTGQNVDGTGTNSAAHGQPNTSDAGGGSVPDKYNGVNGMTGVNANRGDPIAKQLMMFAKDPSTAGDKVFALEAGCGNMWEVAVAKLEQDKGSDPKVKELAAMIEKDHMMAEQKLEPIASKLGVMIPQHLPESKQAMLDLWATMPAEKVDKIFLSNMKADHLKDVNVYADHVKVIQDSDLRTYASDTLPKLREHTAAVLKANADAGMPAETTFSGTPMSMNQ